jgi:hyperosmotically inducible protein
VDELDQEEFEGAPLNDDEITAQVQRLLRRDAATSSLRIRVSTVDGIVTLRGVVQTYEDTDNAAEVASRVSSVVDVLDELEVEE